MKKTLEKIINNILIGITAVTFSVGCAGPECTTDYDCEGKLVCYQNMCINENYIPNQNRQEDETDLENDVIEDSGCTPRACFIDEDGDSYGTTKLIVAMCGCGGGFVDNDDDCDDHNSNKYPGGPIDCNTSGLDIITVGDINLEIKDIITEETKDNYIDEIDEPCITAQLEWSKLFEEARNFDSVKQTVDLGFIVAGSTKETSQGTDVLIMKLNTDGNKIWSKTYGGDDWDGAESIQLTSDGGYVVAGWTKSFGNGKNRAWVLKLDSNGNLMWDKTFTAYHYCDAFSIQQTNDGGYVVAGRIAPGGVNKVDAWVAKINSSGDEQWNKNYGSNEDDIANSVQQTSDGGYIVAGHKNNKPWVFKLDQNGSIKWNYNGSGSYTAWSAKQTSDGGYIISKGDVIKLNSQGSVVWYSDETSGINSVQQTTDGGYVGTGGTSIIKLDGNGNIEWKDSFLTSNWNSSDIQQTNDEGYIVSGYEVSYNPSYNITGKVIKIKSLTCE